MSHREPFVCESLEPRVLLSISIELDYSYDANGFFDDPARREIIEAAADYLGGLLNDSLNAIVPGGGNEWRIQFTNPSTGTAAEINNPVIEEDELLLFVGGREIAGDTLGLGGAGGWQASGSGAFLNNIEGRGQSGATGPEGGQSDTSLWGGSIAFDIDTNWHFGLTTDGLNNNEHDFYSVALHELVHVLGFSDGTPAFANLISPSGEFMGPATMALSDDTQLSSGDLAHWREGLSSAGQETIMDPTFLRGTRKLITPLDFAALQDIGWELEALRWPGRGSSLAISSAGRGVASGSASPQAPGLHWIDTREAGVLDFRIESVNPVMLRLWDSQGLLVAENTDADAITGIGISATDQFYTIEIIAGSATTYNLAVTNNDLDQFAYYPEGYSSTEIDQAVTVSNPTDSAQLFSVSLHYERDDLGRDVDTVAFERVIEPGQIVTVDIIRNRTFAQDVLTMRSILNGEPYSIVLTSSAPLGAALEHADVFGGQRITTSEDFTRQTADTWHFPRVEAFTGISDFLVYHNPNAHEARVEVSFVSSAGQVSLTQVVRAGARGGWSVGDIASLAGNAFGVILTSEAANPADQSDHDGIVAGLTHFDENDGVGWTVLGTPGTLPASSTVPLADIPDSTTQVLVFNPGTSVARLSLVRTTSSGDQMLSERFVPVGTNSALMLPNALGYRYEFTSVVGVVQFVQRTAEETFSASPTGAAASSTVFSLGSFDASDGTTALRLGLHNPSSVDASVTVRFLFLSGNEIEQSVQVSAGSFGSVEIDAIMSVRDRSADFPLAVVLESSQPITGMLISLDGEIGWAGGGMALPA